MSSKSKKPGWKTAQLRIGGMHCANCEVLIERRLSELPGIRKVTARHSAGTAEIIHDRDLDFQALQDAVTEEGYTISQQSPEASNRNNSGKDYLEVGAAFLIVVGAFVLLKELNFLPENVAVPDSISFGLAFVIGVVASVSTCIAVTGGLLVAIAAKHNESSGHLTRAQRFKPHLYFNAGRIISYTLLGGAIGLLGSAFTLSVEATALLIIAASIVMIMLGLQMLDILPKGAAFPLRMPKFLAHKIHDLSERNTKGGAFILGGLTFFLPCGFTQALQLYALAQGSVVTGALVMLAFSLGTLPALLSLSALSSFVRGAFQRYFLRIAGAAVVLLGLFNVQNGLTLGAVATGSSTLASPASATSNTPSPAYKPASLQTARMENGKQIIEMRITGLDYVPHQFSVVQGIPVEWRIDAREAIGCGRILIAPAAGIRTALRTERNVLTFAPQYPGDIRFNCSMGMMTRGAVIRVVASVPGVSTPNFSPLPDRGFPVIR